MAPVDELLLAASALATREADKGVAGE
eukprot:COSAG02_NODE_6595_length_3471_cov_8.811981_1_plen_26_part_10